MASPVWRYLGLSVAGGYTILGIYEILFPHQAAAEFFALPDPRPPPPPRKRDSDDDNDKAEVSQAVSILTPLLGVRDLSLAAAMFAFAAKGQWREVGTVIMAGTILCAADTAVVWQRMGVRSYVLHYFISRVT